jgi:hypothetical protein
MRLAVVSLRAACGKTRVAMAYLVSRASLFTIRYPTPTRIL